MASNLEEVKALIIDVLKIDGENIASETRFIEDLKADSMDQFFLIDGISEKFKLNISDEDARLIKTVGDAINYIETHKS